MNNLFAISVTVLIVLITFARIVQLVSLCPSATARIWPWLRLQRWWPVAADHVAEHLLRDMLTPKEYGQLRLKAFLEVPSQLYAGRVYQVPRGPGQVMVVEGGRVVERLCLQPLEALPEADVILMHKLLLESDEKGYLATANHFPRPSWH
jgi:hypothetical protein